MCDQESCAEDCDSWISAVVVVTVLRECLCVSPPPVLRARIILRIQTECGQSE